MSDRKPLPGPGPSILKKRKTRPNLKKKEDESTVVPILIDYSSRGEKVQNPLQIDVILREVSSYLEIPELKACRLVNHQFKEHANHFLSKTHTPVSLQNCTTVRRFAKYQRERLVQEKPIFSKFELKNKVTPAMLIGIGSFGNNIVHLNLDVESRSAARIDPAVVNFENVLVILHETPNLVSLKMNGVSFPSRGSFVTFAPIGLQRLRYLKSISISSRLSNVVLLPFAIIDRVRYKSIARRLMRISRVLTDVSFDFHPVGSFMSPGEVEIIKSWFYLPLTDLISVTNLPKVNLTKLALLSSVDHPGIAQDLLFIHSKTIKDLELRLPSIITTIAINNAQRFNQLFPVMRNLEALTLHAPYTPYTILPHPLGLIPSINPFPILKKLSVLDNLLQTYFPPESSFPSVQELTIFYDGLSNGESTYTKKVDIFEILPNMNKLNVHVTGGFSEKLTKSVQKMFKSAKHHGGNVKNLTFTAQETHRFGMLYGPYKLDELFTGLPATDFFLQFLAQAAEDSLDIGKLTETYQKVTTPSLVNFKNLDILEINATAVEPVNDAVAFLALYSLKPLKKLVLHHSNISDYYKNILAEHHPNTVFN